jgi:hypothetical protein
VLAELTASHGLGDATDIVIGGCSAGGIATFAHLDYVASSLAALAPRARVVGFPDSGFYSNVPYFSDKKRFPFQAQNASATLSQRCLAEHAAAPHLCLVAEVNTAYIKTPLFAWQSKFDYDQLSSSVSPPCNDSSCAIPYSEHLVAAMLRGLFGRGGGSSKPAAATRPAHGAFIDGCYRHCDYVASGGGGSSVANITAQGLTPLQAIAKWYGQSGPDKALLIEQAAPVFPCPTCC